MGIKRTILAFSVFCLSLLFHQTHSVVIQDLGGNDWISYNQNKSIHVNSSVPGSIYTDLNKAGVLKGHLYDNFNDVEYRWVSYDNWTFEKHFNVDENVLKQTHIFLTAHGLDTIGNATLNGHLVGSVEDMFIRYKWEVKSLLKSKDNLIQVSFESAPLYGKKKHEESVKQNYPIPMYCRSSHERGECHANHIRKMAASFAWDWGPAFPTQGIWKPLVLEGFNTAIVRTVSVDTIPKSDNSWTLNTTVWLDGVQSSNVSIDLTFALSGSLLSEKKSTHVVFDNNGEALVNLMIEVPAKLNIKRWWPNGMGKQSLYDFKVTATSGSESSSKSQKIGFRTIELSQEQLLVTKNNDIANAFYFKVNNASFFSKGSNWIPAHVLYEAISDEYLYDLLRSTKLANMNMLRVWGGGFYESDHFYDICDQLGIMVTQDMMFASSLYPADDHFLGLVVTELKQQIRRLQHHPSIILWSGNNENEGNIAGPYWQDIKSQWDRYKADYIKLTINVTMEIVIHEDPLRPFVSSSPSSGIADKRKGYIAHQDARAGDMHWYIGGDVWDWHRYPKSKFVSEYGFQSLSSMQLLEKHIDREWLKFPITKGIDHRQHLDGSDGLLDMIKTQFHLPKSGGVEALADFVYLNQVFQAMAIKIETEFYRRDRKVFESGEGMTMGALYWQLNEIWPGFSWSSLEYGGKWKLLHYYVKNFFDNLVVDIYEDGDVLKVVIVRDDHRADMVQVNVTIEVFDWSSQSALHSHHLTTSTSPFSVSTVFEHNSANFLTQSKCAHRTHCFISVSISASENVHKKNFLLLSRVKDMVGLSKAQIKLQVSGPVSSVDESGSLWKYTLHLQTDHIAPFVLLDLVSESNVQGIFSDNGFILTNQTSVTFQTKTKLTNIELSNLITIRSLKDVNFE